MKIFKIILNWLKWKFRVVKGVVENIKTPKHSHTQEKARRRKQIAKGYLKIS